MADAVSALGIAGIAVLTAAAFVWVMAGRDRKRTTALVAILVAAFALSAWAALSGVLQRFDRIPPPMALMIGLMFATGLAIGLSPLGRTAASGVPLTSLVGLQAFRLPLELVMHRAGGLGIMPVELSYSGYNFDIVTGTGALILFVLARAGAAVPRWAVWAWNVWGCWCLAVIAFIAIATSPMVRLFGDDPRHVNTWVLFFPYVWLPAVLVTIAVTGHVVITRALLRPAGAAAR